MEVIPLVKYETFVIEGRSLTKAYSDNGFLIRNVETGDEYSEAVDPTETNRRYEETDIPAEDDMTAEEALSLITGGET